MGVSFKKPSNQTKLKKMTTKFSSEFSEKQNLDALKNYGLLTLQKSGEILESQSKHNIFKYSNKSTLNSEQYIKKRSVSESDSNNIRFTPFPNRTNFLPPLLPYNNKNTQNLRAFQQRKSESFHVGGPSLCLPEKKTVFEDLQENIANVRLSKIQKQAKDNKVHVSIENFNKSLTEEDQLSERQYISKKKTHLYRNSIELDYSKTPQSKNSIISEIKQVWTDKQLNQMINLSSPNKLHSNPSSSSNFKMPFNRTDTLKAEFSVFSPKRMVNPLITSEIKSDFETTQTIMKHKSQSDLNVTTMKYVKGAYEKYYKDSPKEPYRRIFEKMNGKDKDEQNSKNFKVESLHNGKVIICKKDDLITRNHKAIKILKNFNEISNK